MACEESLVMPASRWSFSSLLQEAATPKAIGPGLARAALLPVAAAGPAGCTETAAVVVATASTI